MLSLQDIVVRLAGRTILDNASAQLAAGWRVGLIGRNGAGKTTLLRLILGELGAESGRVAIARGLTVGTVAQEAPGGATTPTEAVLAADRERTALLAEAETETDGLRLGEIHERLAAIGADAAPARAASILSGLGFDTEAQARPLSSFSGGWRMRVALAAVLFARPDLLLLDEPTNHLDLEAALWLEEYLKRYPGTLILVSHDRDLLDSVPDHILHLESGRTTLYAGNYTRFTRTLAERRLQADRERTRRDSERARIQAFVDRFRAKASKARQAQSRLKMLAKIETIADTAIEPPPDLSFPPIKPLASPVITLEDVAVGYDGRAVLRRLSLSLQADDRIALLGANGNGKTTLARLLAGRLEPLAGTMTRAGKLKVGYFAQHQIEDFTPSRTAYHHMAERLPEAREQKVRAALGRFGFSGDRAEVAVESLSGGEKARLALALIAQDAPQLLILDEPTNHLDIDARAALVEALNDYEGAVILVSHDRRMLETAADQLWLVEGGTARPFDGDIDDYRRLVLGRAGGGRDGQARRAAPPNTKVARRTAAERRGETAPLRKRLADVEARLDALGREKAEIEAALADPATYDGPPARVTELGRRKSENAAALAVAEAEWLAAGEALEVAKGEGG
ncbi:MAG: ABC-F family ATP-binding cassette domain-containing protein [Alphaproteobacteria bacterium]|nr:ABC-F family ATP-binding cassette domain-containing protein [Alphaproteobacteria bacterium]